VEINLAFINSANLIGFADNSFTRSSWTACWLKSLAELLIEIYALLSPSLNIVAQVPIIEECNAIKLEYLSRTDFE
jgi:hypothetical protein